MTACPLCGCPLTQDNSFPGRPGVCRACGRIRQRIMCHLCGKNVSQPNPRRVHCALCRVIARKARQRAAYVAKQLAKAMGLPEKRTGTYNTLNHGHGMGGKRLCLECCKT